MILLLSSFFFFFNDTATTEIYTLSLHDALPISISNAEIFIDTYELGIDVITTIPNLKVWLDASQLTGLVDGDPVGTWADQDRKSTRLNSSHLVISYAVFCLKKKKQKQKA